MDVDDGMVDVEEDMTAGCVELTDKSLLELLTSIGLDLMSKYFLVIGVNGPTNLTNPNFS